jgi:lipopolysaccharide/colanic/teichoic acid biosynthesis glycosyltransferase
VFFKFLFDRLAAFFGLLLTWPLLLVIGLKIKSIYPGETALFRQERVGRHGKVFVIYKFRTMPVVPFTERLRKYKLDELPQLWNILKGEMSLVGPRPDVPGYADQLEGDDREMLELRPGITGPASLKYRDEEELLARQENPLQYNDEVIFPDKVRINRYYLHHWSFWTDLRIIWATVLGKHILYGGEII